MIKKFLNYYLFNLYPNKFDYYFLNSKLIIKIINIIMTNNKKDY